MMSSYINRVDWTKTAARLSVERRHMLDIWRDTYVVYVAEQQHIHSSISSAKVYY